MGHLEVKDWAAIATMLVNFVAIPVGVYIAKYVKNLATKSDLASLKTNMDQTFVSKVEFNSFLDNWPPQDTRGMSENNVRQLSRERQKITDR